VFGTEKETRDAVGTLIVISELTLNIDEELCACVRVLVRRAESICKCKLDQTDADPKRNLASEGAKEE
jgi:hypothetical protein